MKTTKQGSPRLLKASRGITASPQHQHFEGELLYEMIIINDRSD